MAWQRRSRPSTSAGSAKHPPAFRRRDQPDRVAARRVIDAHRPDPSRSVAETAALEAPFRSGRNNRAIRPHFASRRRSAFRHRYRRLCRMDAAALHPIGATSTGRRNAPTIGRTPWPDFTAHALSRQSRARGARVVLSDISPVYDAARQLAVGIASLPDLPEADHALRGRCREPSVIGERGIEPLTRACRSHRDALG